MKGIMAVLLCIGLAGMATAQSSTNNFAPSNQNRVIEPRPWQIPLSDELIPGFKRQGMMFDEIEVDKIPAVNGVIFFHEDYPGQSAKLGDIYGLIQPVEKTNSELIFEFDDSDIEQIRSKGLVYKFSPLEIGRYRVIRAYYAPNGAARGSAIQQPTSSRQDFAQQGNGSNSNNRSIFNGGSNFDNRSNVGSNNVSNNSQPTNQGFGDNDQQSWANSNIMGPPLPNRNGQPFQNNSDQYNSQYNQAGNIANNGSSNGPGNFNQNQNRNQPGVENQVTSRLGNDFNNQGFNVGNSGPGNQNNTGYSPRREDFSSAQNQSAFDNRSSNNGLGFNNNQGMSGRMPNPSGNNNGFNQPDSQMAGNQNNGGFQNNGGYSPNQNQFNQNQFNQNQFASNQADLNQPNWSNTNPNNSGNSNPSFQNPNNQLDQFSQMQQEIAQRKARAMEDRLRLDQQELSALEEENFRKNQSLAQRSNQSNNQTQFFNQGQGNQVDQNNQNGFGNPSGYNNTFPYDGQRRLADNSNAYDFNSVVNRLAGNPPNYGDQLTNRNVLPTDRGFSPPVPRPTNVGYAGIPDWSASIPGRENLNRNNGSADNPNGNNYSNQLVGDGTGYNDGRNSTNQSGLVGNPANDSTFAPAMYFMLLCSLGLNLYLGWISRNFYVRYGELADELRETFSATL